MKAELSPGSSPVLGRVVPGGADLAGVPMRSAMRVPGQLLSPITAWHVLRPTVPAPAGDGYFKPWHHTWLSTNCPQGARTLLMKEECKGYLESLRVPADSLEQAWHPQLPGQQENPVIWSSICKSSTADIWHNRTLSKGLLPHTLMWKATSMRMHMNPGQLGCPVLPVAASPRAA